MIIAIDFDGTIVEHQFPDIGREVPGAIRVMKALQESGHQLILWTMRSDIEEPHSEDPTIIPEGGDYLTQAVQYLNQRGVTGFWVNCNPEQTTWTHSPKAYAHIYIDDAALGCPLTRGVQGDRPYVDWQKIEIGLIENGILPTTPKEHSTKETP